VAVTSIVFGLLLVVLGLGGWAGTGMVHPTALIPAGFGVVLAALGFVARTDRWRKHAMHAAAVVALVGFIAVLVMAVPHLGELISTGAVKRADGSDATYAVLEQLAMTVLCGVFVGLCVKSFIDARRRRRADAAAAGTAAR
jgi:hypothetical protein